MCVCVCVCVCVSGVNNHNTPNTAHLVTPHSSHLSSNHPTHHALSPHHPTLITSYHPTTLHLSHPVTTLHSSHPVTPPPYTHQHFHHTLSPHHLYNWLTFHIWRLCVYIYNCTDIPTYTENKNKNRVHILACVYIHRQKNKTHIPHHKQLITSGSRIIFIHTCTHSNEILIELLPLAN